MEFYDVYVQPVEYVHCTKRKHVEKSKRTEEKNVRNIKGGMDVRNEREREEKTKPTSSR